MVTPQHIRKLGLRHVTGDALIAQAVSGMVAVRRGIIDQLLMTWQTSLIRLFLEAKATTRSMAMHTVQVSRFHAGT
jgi:hypothetical protein